MTQRGGIVNEYRGFPKKYKVWSRSYKIPLLVNAITRIRYFKLRHFLQFVNNCDITDDAKNWDKLWKIQPVIDNFHRAILQLLRELNVRLTNKKEFLFEDMFLFISMFRVNQTQLF